MASKYKYERNDLRGYVVTHREDERLLGTIWKNERRYNLRRVIVIKGWSARVVGGPTLGTGEPHIYRTREAAAEALEEKVRGWTA